MRFPLRAAIIAIGVVACVAAGAVLFHELWPIPYLIVILALVLGLQGWSMRDALIALALLQVPLALAILGGEGVSWEDFWRDLTGNSRYHSTSHDPVWISIWADGLFWSWLLGLDLALALLVFGGMGVGRGVRSVRSKQRT